MQDILWIRLPDYGPVTASNEVNESLVLLVDREQAFHTILNIGHNAVQAIRAREDGHAGAAKISRVRENGMVALDAIDKGPGLP